MGLMKNISIGGFSNSHHRAAVIVMWSEVFGYQAAHNQPERVIDLKIAVDDGLFFVATSGDEVIGTVMAGYDGHRGWIYSVAVSPAHRRKGLGSELVSHAEAALASRGCLKVNLQVVEANAVVVDFYRTLGYEIEPRVSMGKRLKA